MSNFSYDDFAVLVRKFNPEMLSPESLKSLRIVPLSTAPSMADAIKGTNLEGLDSDLNLPKQKNGNVVDSNVTVQHDSAGYCRLVGHIEAVKPQGGQGGQGVPVTTAKAFVLYRTVTDASDKTSKKEVLAVASLKEGFEIGDVCYPSFTITTVNNYQSVAFNPNAFATVEDLKKINGLDGLHIAFDTASGDLKLLDGKGNVLDQANLPIKADVIIADGEEGYKYVKTDVAQDIHAAKAWMPEGSTAWKEVLEAPYTMQHAALVVEKVSSPATREFVPAKSENVSYPISTQPVVIRHVEIGDSIYMLDDVSDSTCALFRVKGDAGSPYYHPATLSGNIVTITDASTTESVSLEVYTSEVGVDVITIDGNLYVLGETPNLGDSRYRTLSTSIGGNNPQIYGYIKTSGGSSADRVLGIAVKGGMMYAFDVPESKIHNISGGEVSWLGLKDIPAGTSKKYGLEAFVWTVKDEKDVASDTFFGKLNASLLALGFHEGDDIALGTNLSILAPAEGVSPLNEVDADEYMHGETKNESGETPKELREKEVDEQRKLAKEELVAWNAQHPALDHDGLSGTRISSDGVDIRNGKILIGDGFGLGADSVKHYELSTNFRSDVDSKDEGLALNVLDASGGALTRNVLTISDSSYISGAPICMVMTEITESNGVLSLETKRRTACFGCLMEESNGTVNITITDNRLNSKGFATTFGARNDCIVEISPVYISGNSAPEMLPSLNMVNTVATVGSTVDGAGKNDKLTCTCPQIIDWANSVNISSGSGARMFVIVKVY